MAVRTVLAKDNAINHATHSNVQKMKLILEMNNALILIIEYLKIYPVMKNGNQ